MINVFAIFSVLFTAALMGYFGTRKAVQKTAESDLASVPQPAIGKALEHLPHRVGRCLLLPATRRTELGGLVPRGLNGSQSKCGGPGPRSGSGLHRHEREPAEPGRPGAKLSEGVCESFRLQGMMAGLPACYFCIKAFSETDQTEDLKKIDVPTLIQHGDDDQIVPIADSAMLSSKIVKNAKLVVYKGGPHGMCTTEKDRVNADLLAFIKG
jgi:pimeloyl-ACP methyl ester carboxylesterase